MKRDRIPFTRIILSTDNPRLAPSFSEQEELERMIFDQKGKLAELAYDIVQYGLNPLDLIAVIPSDIYPGYYEVVEGNRRVCALKLLCDPTPLHNFNLGLFSKFEEMSIQFTCPDTLEVVVFTDDNEALHWMEIRHMGEQSGKGLAKWNSVQKMRFQKQQTGFDALLDFWNWMENQEVLSYSQIMSVTKTNWQRVLREAYFPFLKIRFAGKYIVDVEDMPIFVERIRAVQRNLDGQTVGIVYDQERIDCFYDNLSIELYGTPYKTVVENEKKCSEQITFDAFEAESTDSSMPVKTYSSSEASSFCSASMGNSDNRIDDKETDCFNMQSDSAKNGECVLPNTIECNKYHVGKDLFNGCCTIIPYGYSIRSSNKRLNKIINELKQINPDEYPNACGLLLRALFELSAKAFLESKAGEDMTKVDFTSAITKAANQLRDMKRISDSEHSAVKHDIDSLRLIFNGYMHNTDSYPSSMALKNLFNAHSNFIKECLKF